MPARCPRARRGRAALAPTTPEQDKMYGAWYYIYKFCDPMRGQLVKPHPVLAAILSLTALAANASAADRCVSYGDEKTDFTWRLCPAGEKYERQYLYFGVWSNFYRVDSSTGACDWSQPKSGWICPDRAVRCDSKRCVSG
jgi:hypothetical protein